MENRIQDLVWYQLRFRQLSPLHIGMRNYGVLSETRLFIPGWTMWGALVRCYGDGQGGTSEKYEEGKKRLATISCFYPEVAGEPLSPHWAEGELQLGSYNERNFRQEFTDVFVSTAIRPGDLSAKDSSLHETEILLPRAKSATKKTLTWVGVLGIKSGDDDDFKTFVQKLKQVYVGGEAAYGMGKLEISQEPLVQLTEENLKKWSLHTDGSLDLNESCVLKNYLEISGASLLRGKMEFAVQYDFTKSAGKPFSQGYYCWVPGSEVNVQGKSRSALKRGIFSEEFV